MFRRPGIQTQTFKYVESSFGMRNSNLGERNVIVVSITSRGEDPNTYPIVPKGKNFQTKKKPCMNQSQCRYAPLTIYIYICVYNIYRSFLHQRRKTWKKSHALQGGTAINTHLSYLQKLTDRRFEKNDAIQSFEGLNWNLQFLDYFTTFSHPTPPPICKKDGLGASTQDLQMKSSPPRIMPLSERKIDILIPGI